jgi:thiaminase
MSEDKEKYSGDLYGYEVMLRVLDEETWIVDVRDEVTDEYVDGYEFENYDEAVTEYKLQVNHLCNNKEPKLCNELN